MQRLLSKTLLFSLSLFLIFVMSPVVNANEQEVAHLLTFIESSDCTFKRNNKDYTPAKARKHIERKYKHVKDRISTTEEFIRYAATESSITHKAYTVNCGIKETQPSSEWLLLELHNYRAAKKKDNDS